MEDEAKFCSPICSTFEALVVKHVVRHHHGELSPFCWPMLDAAIVVFSAVYWLLSILLRCNDFAGTQKTVVDQTSRRPPNSNHNLFLVQVSLWKVLWSFWFNHQAGHCQLSYKTHVSSHISIYLRNGSLTLHRIREDDISKQHFFFLICQLMRHSLTKFFHLSNLLQIPNDHRVIDIWIPGQLLM